MKHCGRTLALVVALAAALALGVARPSAAQTVTDLGTLDGYSNSGAVAVNASGMAVGYVYNTNSYGYPAHTLAAVWSPGATTPTALPLLSGYTDSMAKFVNASGQIAGDCDNGIYNAPQACVWTFDGTNWTVTGLGFLAGTSDNKSEVYGMNAAGQVVGRSSQSGADGWSGFIWDSTDGMQPFTNLPEGILSIIPPDRHGISDTGLVVGAAMATGNSQNGAIVWDSKTKQTVAHLPSGEALAISPSGNQVAGWFLPDTSDFWRKNAFLLTWDAAQTAFVQSDLGHPAYDSGSPGWTLAGWDAYPSSVTDDGKVLGFGRNYWDTDGDAYPNTSGPDETWVYSNGAFTDLSTLLPAGTVGNVDISPSINASGTIVFNLTGAAVTPYVWNGSGVAQALPDLGGGRAVAGAINDSGFVTGASSVATDSSVVHATLWKPASAPSALDFSTASVSVKGRALTVKIRIAASNPGTEQATDVTVTTASLAGVSTTTSLPLALRTIRAGASKTISLTFDSVPSNSEVELKISGTCSLGDFFTTQTVIIP